MKKYCFFLFLIFSLLASNVVGQNKTNDFPFAIGGRLLKKGNKGKDVTKLKIILKSEGFLKVEKDYHFKEKEKFDKKTKLAVLQFQAKHKLRVSGVADAITLYYLQFERK